MVEIDPVRQKEAKKYALIHRRLMLVDLGFGAVYLLAWLVSGWAIDLRSSLQAISVNPWLLVALFGLIFGGIYYVIDLPLSYYSEFILPHRFGMSTQTLRGWIGDQLKMALIGVPLGGLLLELVYWLLRSSPSYWWLWTAAFMLVFSVLLSNLAPVLIAPLFYKFVPLGDEFEGLKVKLMRLAEKSHTTVKGVYQFDMSRRSRAANAALFGLGSTRRIILGDTLLKEFSEDEIETVLAHELGHQVHNDIWVLIALQSIITLAGLYLASLGLQWAASLAGLLSPGDPAGLPLLGLILGAFGLVTMPLSNTITRWRERLADEYALQATGKGAAFASAFTRLANQNLAETDPERWVEIFLYDHPALHRRIRMAEEWKG